MIEPEIQPSTWDRIVWWASHPIRAAAWVVAVGVTVGPFGGLSWVVSASVGAMLGIAVGEVFGRSRLRTPAFLGLLFGVAGMASLVQGFATRYGLVPSVLGPLGTHWLGLLLSVGTTAFVALAGLRALARRGPAFNVVEVGLLGALLAGAVASHRDGAIARPLWLSDLAWSFGVDPGRVLLAGGGLLTALLAALLLIGSERRKPTLALLGLPFLALVALLFVNNISVLDEPDPKGQLGMEAMGDGGEGGSKGQGGQGDSEEESKGQSGGKDGAEGGGTPDTEAPDPMAGGGGGENRPVAVVLLDDDHVPPSGMWYLRQDVLPALFVGPEGTRLVPSDVDGTHADLLDHFAVRPEQVELGLLGKRKTIRGSVSLLVDHPVPFAPASALAFAPRGNPNPARFKRSYAFASAALRADLGELIRDPVGDPTWRPELLAHYLEIPDDPRYVELAEQIRTDLRTELADRLPPDEPIPPVLLAVGVVEWVGENMKYSRRERHADVRDSTADFLFGNRIGYCVHSSHAAVYLWRALGIPARVATGYAVEESARRGGTLVVMNGDAHAWSELYVQDVGWVPLDVAPSEDLDATDQGLPPDEDDLRALGDLARDAPDLEGPRPDYSWVWTWVGYTGGGLVGSFGFGVLFLHWTAKAWRRSRPLWAPADSLSRVGYRAALDVLTDAGLVRQPGETREAFARRLHDDVPVLTELTALHLRGALGRPGDADPERDRALWTGRLANLRYELQQTVPLWRRLLGFLDPSTPYRSR